MSALTGEVIVCSQHSGADIELRIFGDEFYSRYESLAGYSVIYDSNAGEYCYAQLDSGHFVSSGIASHQKPPEDLPKHLLEDNTVRALSFDYEYSRIRPNEEVDEATTAKTLGREGGLLPGRKLHQGNIKGLTILVNFSDIKTRISTDDVDEMMNADNFTLNGNFSSVKKYYELMSSGKLIYQNKVIGPVELPNRRSYYIKHSLIKEVLDKAVNDFDLDMSEFDSQDENIVDAINILYAGRSQYSGSLWPHNSWISLQYGNTRTHYFMLTGLGKNRSELNIGTICHENGHMLCRFPDLYDYGSRDNDQTKSYGLGRYCLMANGNYLNRGKTPSPLSPYLRDLAGWTDTTVSLNEAGQFTAKQGEFGRLLKFQTPLSNEYFLVENRLGQGLDEHLPSHGLAVYHCDTLGSNEWQQGSINKHYQVALLQADGRRDLENKHNRGDGNDLFKPKAGVVVSAETNPSSKQWDNADSGLMISDIERSGDDIIFTAGEVSTITTQSVTSANNEANEIIPDNEAGGITDYILLETGNDALVKQVSVNVDITHGYMGDLSIKLISPQGTEITLLNENDLLNQVDFQHQFNKNSTPELETILDEAAEGEWALQIIDHADLDIGRLNSWAIEVEHGTVFG